MGLKKGIKTLKEQVDKQLEFIKWLESEGLYNPMESADGLYNPMESADIMQRMYDIWEAAKLR